MEDISDISLRLLLFLSTSLRSYLSLLFLTWPWEALLILDGTTGSLAPSFFLIKFGYYFLVLEFWPMLSCSTKALSCDSFLEFTLLFEPTPPIALLKASSICFCPPALIAYLVGAAGVSNSLCLPVWFGESPFFLDPLSRYPAPFLEAAAALAAAASWAFFIALALFEHLFWVSQ